MTDDTGLTQKKHFISRCQIMNLVLYLNLIDGKSINIENGRKIKFVQFYVSAYVIKLDYRLVL